MNNVIWSHLMVTWWANVVLFLDWCLSKSCPQGFLSLFSHRKTHTHTHTILCIRCLYRRNSIFYSIRRLTTSSKDGFRMYLLACFVCLPSFYFHTLLWLRLQLFFMLKVTLFWLRALVRNEQCIASEALPSASGPWWRQGRPGADT